MEPEQMNQAQKWVDYVLSLGPELFTCLVFIVAGYVFKICRVPGPYIPASVIAGATLFYGFAVNNSISPHWVSDPLPWKFGIGFVIGFVAWVAHNKVLNKWVDPLLNKKLKDGER